jgi:LysM repeat protein
MLPGVDRCPICGAHREVATPLRLSLTTIVLGALALVALGVAVLLLQPKPEIVTSILPTATITPTVTVTPSATLRHTQTPTRVVSPTASDTPTATPSPTPEYVLYKVQFGDSLASIARKHGITVVELRQLNDLTAGVEPVVGQELAVPPISAPETPTLSVTTLAVTDPDRVIHVIQQGENLLRIADHYGVPLDTILKANDLTENSVLDVGQELIIVGADPKVLLITPSPTEIAPITHTVVRGDNLGKIALQYGVNEDEIARANGITSETTLSIGQKLIIPQTRATPESTVTAQLTATETGTPTQIPSITPTPSATYDMPSAAPTSPALAYPQPLPLAPPQGAVFAAETLPLLNWTSSGILDDNEWYLVRVWYGPERTRFVSLKTQATSVRLPAELYAAGWPAFYWQVVVVRQRGQTAVYTAISPESAVHTFSWR